MSRGSLVTSMPLSVSLAGFGLRGGESRSVRNVTLRECRSRMVYLSSTAYCECEWLSANPRKYPGVAR